MKRDVALLRLYIKNVVNKIHTGVNSCAYFLDW